MFRPSTLQSAKKDEVMLEMGLHGSTLKRGAMRRLQVGFSCVPRHMPMRISRY